MVTYVLFKDMVVIIFVQQQWKDDRIMIDSSTVVQFNNGYDWQVIKTTVEIIHCVLCRNNNTMMNVDLVQKLCQCVCILWIILTGWYQRSDFVLRAFV